MDYKQLGLYIMGYTGYFSWVFIVLDLGIRFNIPFSLGMALVVLPVFGIGLYFFKYKK